MRREVLDGIVMCIYSCLGAWVFPRKGLKSKAVVAENIAKASDLIVGGFVELGLCINSGLLYVYNGKHYERITDEQVCSVCLRCIVELEAQAYRDEITLRVLRGVKMHAFSRVSDKRNRSYIGFSNVVLDLYSWELKDFGKDIMIFKTLPYAYDSSVRSYKWAEFVSAVIPDVGYRRLFQEYVGSLLISRFYSCNDYMLVMHGKRSSGKKELLKVIEAVLGEDNVSHFKLKEIVDSGDEFRRILGRMDRKFANIDYEYGGGLTDKHSDVLRGVISADPFEAYTSSGAMYTVRHLPHLIVNASQLPPVTELSYGVKSQMLIIPFEHEVESSMRSMSKVNELVNDCSSIFNWVMEGLQRYVKNGRKFTDIKLITTSMRAYQASHSTVLRFMVSSGYRSDISEYLEEVPVWTNPNELYEEYVKWCIFEEEPKVSYAAFEKAVRGAGYKFKLSESDTLVALYGQKAIMRQTKILSMRRAKAEYKEYLELQKREGSTITWSTIERYAQNLFTERGWNRIVVGFDELTDYVGVGQNWPDQMLRGNLEGCYVEDHGVYYFNLDAIDTVWRPVYERGLKKRNRKKNEDKLYKEQVTEKSDEQ